MSNEPKFFLEEMELDEISTVTSGDNPTADILIFKSDDEIDKGGDRGCSCGPPKPGTPVCAKCGMQVKMGMQATHMRKMMPGSQDLHVEKPLDDEDFKHAKKLKRKKQLKLMKQSSDITINKWASIERRRQFR